MKVWIWTLALVGILASGVALADGDLVVMFEHAAEVAKLPNSSSQVTTIVSIVGGVVGAIALLVAWAQMRMANAKVRLDLYNKRFEIYVAALNYHNAIWFGDHEKVKEVGSTFIKYFRESRFLFKKESGIYATLEKMKDSGSVVRGFMEREFLILASAYDNADELKPLREASRTAREGFESLLRKLEDQMEEYIKFHNVRGWTFF